MLLQSSTSSNLWKAKLTDYGSVNFVRKVNTPNPGSPAYSAPEAVDPREQSPKMDIYSFGVLVLEMLTGKLVEPGERHTLLIQVHYEQFLHLIQRCCNETPRDRPSACVIITELPFY